jgi:hypothetical protein
MADKAFHEALESVERIQSSYKKNEREYQEEPN